MVFAWFSLGFRMVFAWFCGVSATSAPFHSGCASRTPRTTTLPIIETLPRPKKLRRFGGAHCSLGLPGNALPTPAWPEFQIG